MINKMVPLNEMELENVNGGFLGCLAAIAAVAVASALGVGIYTAVEVARVFIFRKR